MGPVDDSADEPGRACGCNERRGAAENGPRAAVSVPPAPFCGVAAEPLAGLPLVAPEPQRVGGR
eukprot:4714967-Alexandrium_andersonii.AAC.1